VVSRFNEAITQRLYAGALEALTKYGAESGQVEAVQVPGAFELPAASLRLARSGRVHAIIALGAVIRGETPHFQFVADGATVGLTQVALQTGVPVAFGVLTCDTLAQAEASGVAARLRMGGAELLVDTCSYIAPILRAPDGPVMTDSGKWAYYAPGNIGAEVVLGSLAECVASAVAGQVVRDATWGAA
jgi:6,7-dimethyl-8-ribityllumazine synthase